jgi:hypothetical protein
MSETASQSLKNHGRIDPPFHFVSFTLLLVNLGIVIAYAVRNMNLYSAWAVIFSVGIFIPFFRIRIYALKVQDRVIRLEERLRLQALAPAEWHTQIYRLSEDQLIALRFASDSEVVELAKQALEHNLDRKQIKERIKSWRADNWRV